MKRSMGFPATLAAVGLCGALGLAACGSSEGSGGNGGGVGGGGVAGGGGGGNGGVGGDDGTLSVAGTVSSPGGQLAQAGSSPLRVMFASLLTSTARAQAVAGFSGVPGATVYLFRIDRSGAPVGTPVILAQTTTNAMGQFTIVLPLGVGFASDLMVQVTNAGSPQPLGSANAMAAPVVGTTVDVNPISEHFMREVIAFLAGNPTRTLADFSAFELSELRRVIRAAVIANPALVGATVAATLSNLSAALGSGLINAIQILGTSTNFLVLLSSTLPDGVEGAAYSQPILAIGNPGTLRYTVTGGNLPLGLTLNSVTGVISGTPTAAGTSVITIEVGLGVAVPSPVTRDFDLTIAPALGPGLERVSVATGGAQANGASSAFIGLDRVSISRDGNYVAFSSEATNLVTGDTNAQPDVFVRNRQGSGTTTRVSVTSTGAQGTSDSIRPMISGNGRYVVFSSKANLDPLDTSATNVYDIYRHDLTTGQTRLINTFGVNQQFGGYTNPPFPATNHAGNLVAWSDGWFEILIFDLASGVPIPVGAVVANDIQPPPANPFVLNPVVSDSGRFVAFVTNRAYVAADTNGFADVYLADLGTTTPTLTRLTDGSSETAVSLGVSISADGSLIGLTSRDAEAAGDTNGFDDVYVFDRTAGTKTRVSLGSGGTNTNGASTATAISADGQFVAFQSTATNIAAGDSNNRFDIYVYDRNTGTTRRVSINTNPALGGGSRPWLTGTGDLTVFTSTASDLTSNDTNGVSDVFVAP